MSTPRPDEFIDDGFIVVGQDHTGCFTPAARPMVHTTEALAVAEADRLAQTNPGKRFAVFACIGVAVVEKPSTFRITRFRFNAEIPF